MSKMRNTGKPPLAKSPIRLRPRRTVRSASLQTQSVPQTPPGSLIKSQKAHLTRSVGVGEEESKFRPEYNSISWELRALARMVKEDLGAGGPEVGGEVMITDSPAAMFERGRCYDEYSARRNERLAKRNQVGDPCLGVRVESSKRRIDAKRSKSLCKLVETTPAPRYALRSMSKESEKKKAAAAVTLSVRSFGSERKAAAAGSRSYRRI